MTTNETEAVIASFSGPYAFLSNFYPSPILIAGILYPTAEHAFQAMKTDDNAERVRIAALDTPGKAKRAGRKVKLRRGWNELRLTFMRSVVREKLAQNPQLAAGLLATGNAELIEGNHWNDTFWGVCRGKGENHLGKILMGFREQMRRTED